MSGFVEDNPVLSITLLVMAALLCISHIREKIVFVQRSNLKYKVLDFLANFIHYGENIGIIESLSLDAPSASVLERRKEGQRYLQSQLGGGDGTTTTAASTATRGQVLSLKLVDCRFALSKVCVPLLRELEFTPKRNFITKVSTDNHCMHKVTVDTGDGSKDLLYCGSDAVHTLGVDHFHRPIQTEINRRMSLHSDNQQSSLRFAPIAMNTELEKNAELILQMTRMDQVSKTKFILIFIHHSSSL